MSENLIPKVYEDMIRMSLEQIRQCWPEPTPEEAERYRLRREAEDRYKNELAQCFSALEASDPLAKIALLHSNERGFCLGCDVDGWEGESPAWPCRTIELIGELKGITLADD